MYVYIYIYIYTHIFIYAHDIYIYIYIYIYTHIHTYIYIYIYILKYSLTRPPQHRRPAQDFLRPEGEKGWIPVRSHMGTICKPIKADPPPPDRESSNIIKHVKRWSR